MNRRTLRTLFVVQGDGRGHMTQALALAPMLRRAGHDVCAAVVGIGERQRPPQFFLDEMRAPVMALASPAFVSDGAGRIRLGSTAARAVRRWRETSASMDTFAGIVDRYEPDLIVSFYSSLAGFHGLWRPAEAPVVAVGHQYMFEHPAYPFASGQPVQRSALRAYTRMLGASADARLALSFYDAPEASVEIDVVPPLLRSSVLDMDGAVDDGSLLVYLMEPAMAADLAAWSDRHPDVEIHCFTAAPPRRHSPALTFHALSGSAFLARMGTCRGLVCTAGFESVSEAMWLGKPVCMIPTPGHYEQRCNARDATNQGAGIAADTIARGLDAFLEYLPTHDRDAAPFRSWVEGAEPRVVGAIERVAGLPPRLPAASGDGASGAIRVPRPRMTPSAATLP